MSANAEAQQLNELERWLLCALADPAAEPGSLGVRLSHGLPVRALPGKRKRAAFHAT